MGLDPIFSEIDASTRSDIRDAVVWNNYWVDTPLQDHLRRVGAVDPFGGGSRMIEPFLYGGPDGGGVDPGQTITITRKQILAAQSYQPKPYATWFGVDDWEMSNGESQGVINSGPNANIDLYTLYLEGLTSRLNTFMEMDFYRHGQASAANGGGAGVTDDRTKLINGAEEALNNGVDPSWFGNTFTTLGGQTRNGTIGNALNSNAQFAGNPDGSAGQISYEFMLQTYKSCINRQDMIGITSTFGYTYIAALYQRQQRFNDVGVKKDGLQWTGIQFEDAMIYDDWLVPSAIDSGFLPTGLVGGGGQTNITSTFVSPAAPTAASRLPASKTITVGETLFWLSGASWKSRPTTSKDWFFGIRRTSAFDNISLDALMMRLGINIYCGSPRDNCATYGFTS